MQTSASDLILRLMDEGKDYQRIRFRLRRRPILRLLAKQNMSQNDLARKCGLSSGFMSQLLTGERLPGPSTRRKIMARFPKAAFEVIFEEIEVDS